MTRPDPTDFQQQLTRLRSPSKPVALRRPSTLGDGIDPPPPDPGPLDETMAARLSFFVPASGAATRLFGALMQLDPVRLADLHALQSHVQDLAPSARPALDAARGWRDLAFAPTIDLPDPARDLPGFLRALHDSDLPGSPKALLPFHRIDGEPAPPLRAHLAEVVALCGAATSPVDVHFTAAAEHLSAVQEQARRAAAALNAEHLRLHVSTQDPATDLPAIELDGRPVRVGERTLCRPGGHGALLKNLPSTADILLIKNIDNAAHPDHLPELIPWRRRVVAALLDLEREHHAHLRAVRAQASAATAARDWLAAFGLTGSTQASAVLEDLHRPLRVCGMVPNQGQPGGGPFWVRRTDGRITQQIVEGVEVDHDDLSQHQCLRASTHFNPVDLACSLRDVDGEPYDLQSFVDSDRWIHTTKVHQGRPIRCLEYPGLWNGSMAGWITRFVQVPAITFNPVKTVADLLSPRHQARP